MGILGGKISLVNCVIKDNDALTGGPHGGYGGGVMYYGYTNPDLTFSNCTLSGNTPCDIELTDPSKGRGGS